LVIRFFNVGQGDAALITTPEGQSVLIDGGPNSQVGKYLAELNIDSLYMVIATHSHDDHIGGLQPLLQQGTAFLRYMDNGRPSTSNTYEDLYAVLNEEHFAYFSAKPPRNIPLGSVTLRILGIPAKPSKENNASVGVLLTYKGFTALFAGDAETQERNYWRANGKLPHVTVLKVAHHGSENGTDAPWLDALRPKVAVISVGPNGYGHPSPETLRLLEQVGAKVYQTYEDGNITLTVDSTGSYSVRTQKDE